LHLKDKLTKNKWPLSNR